MFSRVFFSHAVCVTNRGEVVRKFSTFIQALLFPFFCFSLIASCVNPAKETLPKASGHSGDLYLVMDSGQWKGPLGRTLDSLLRAEMPGLPRKEPLFNMRWIAPEKFNFVLKRRRNLIFAFTLDKSSPGIARLKNLFTPSSLNKIKTNSERHANAVSDVYAKDQEVMYLYGAEEGQLVDYLRQQGKRIVRHFDNTEKKRLRHSLFKAGRITGISDWLQQKFKCGIQIPFGYKLVERTRNFLWVRQINPKDDKTIFIARTDYTSPKQFDKKELVGFRDRICQKYLFEDPAVPDSYLITEQDVPFVPVSTEKVNFKGRFAIKMRGLWRANNFSMGGPFVGYAMVDELQGTFYYIEGLTFSPGKDQREIIRELETILSTFKTSRQLAPKAANKD